MEVVRVVRSKMVGDVRDGNVNDRDEVTAAISGALDEGAAVDDTTTVFDVVRISVRQSGVSGGAVADNLPKWPFK